MIRANRQSKIENQKSKTILRLGWLALLAFALLWRLKNIDAFGLNNDEGAYLMWARLVSEGYPLYSQTYTGAPPLFIEMLALVFKLVGFSIVLGRLLVLAHFIALAAMLAYLSYHIAAWPGAYLSLFLLAITPPFFNFSRQVMLELPAMTFAVAAVLCAFTMTNDELRMTNDAPIPYSLIFSGVLLALSLLIKILHPLAAIPVLFFIWQAKSGGEKRVLRFLLKTTVFGAAALITVLVVFLFFDLNALIDQVFRFRAETRASLPLPLPGNWQRLVNYLSQIWGPGLLALAGIAVSLGRIFSSPKVNNFARMRGLAWVLWLTANIALLMWYDPVFPHHFTILLLPLVLLSAEFIAELPRPRVEFGVRGSPFTVHHLPFTIRLLEWGLLGIALFNLPAMLNANQSLVSITTGGREAEAAEILAQVTRPTDFVMSDSQLLALSADRLTPPPLVDFSLVYIQSGRQTPERLIAMSKEYAVAAVAPWALRMVWLPEYIAWADEHFLVHKVWDNDHQLYFGPKHPAGAPLPNARLTQFEDGVTLLGYSVDNYKLQITNDELRMNETASPVIHYSLPLTLYWRADMPVKQNYTIFTQLIGPDGNLAAQNDSQPIYGYYPTLQWQPGEIVPDRITIDLPPDLPPGSYTLIAGLYDAETLLRLPLADGSGDYAALGKLEIRD